MNNTNENYDIIGDIHGHASTLIQLLTDLGYERDEQGVFFHQERKVVFLGDFIDRGTEEALVINTVKPMVDNGHAFAVMGNHEFNAICYHTNHPETGEPLREHNYDRTNEHEAFLAEYPLGEETTTEVINWFKTLPIYLELDGFRAIHACWHEDTLEEIKPHLNPDNTLSNDLFIKASEKDSAEYDAIEILLKGIEISLPDGFQFSDKRGKVRTRTRIKWWKEGAKTYRDYSQVPKNQLHNIPDIVLPEATIDPEYVATNKPVFVGHYWFTGEPEKLKSNVACLDYSVANKEKLVCYRWNAGDTSLSNSQFVQVDCVENSNDLQ
ncbi:metallophosphoesterase [Cocleimonas flava]|uniref:Calcineurin-like phosphoesterase family protein n=1 Tax=Cocleimonas flava TaxID=634765 RepID=A0A4R1F2P5_9GAMM|nr:metallophosphoesterase [Cocleimonas flava]TCJ87720.1 calcineurin-like phosphoesterase family protein [Cocleimonas flava]